MIIYNKPIHHQLFLLFIIRKILYGLSSEKQVFQLGSKFIIVPDFPHQRIKQSIFLCDDHLNGLFNSIC